MTVKPQTGHCRWCEIHQRSLTWRKLWKDSGGILAALGLPESVSLDIVLPGPLRPECKEKNTQFINNKCYKILFCEN